MSICICGDISEEYACKILNESLFTKKKSEKLIRKYPYKIYKLSERPLFQQECTLKRKGQSNILIGFPSYSFQDLDLVASQFMKNIIAGLVSSRLILTIREIKGLVYGISSNFKTLYEGGYYAIKTSTQEQYVNDVIELIKSEIKDILDKGIQEEEFQRIREYLYGTTFIYAEDINNLGLFYNKQLAYYQAEIITYEDYREKINKIKISEVNEYCKKILDLKKIVCINTLIHYA
jgi:predicted Zn-dependent peptidase